jgi:hypothetical protein
MVPRNLPKQVDSISGLGATATIYMVVDQYYWDGKEAMQESTLSPRRFSKDTVINIRIWIGLPIPQYDNLVFSQIRLVQPFQRSTDTCCYGNFPSLKSKYCSISGEYKACCTANEAQ